MNQPTSTVPDVLSRYRAALDAEMRAVVGDKPTLLYAMMRYHLGWEAADGTPGPGAGGKALRPALCMLAWEGTSAPAPAADAAHRGHDSPALPAAAAIELIHNFSLVHDDIQDGDTERHHRPTVWSIWGMPQGINAGDGLWALATRALLRCATRGVPAAIVLRAQTLLNDACLTMIEGQSLDLAFEERQQVDTEQYLEMIRCKTGALIATALAIGALIGSRDDAVAAAFYRYGEAVGRVFQIQDDVLGIWGQAALTGKSTSSDLRRRKQTYPVVYTLTHGPPAARAVLAEVYAAAEIDDAAVARAVWALDEADARRHALDLATAAHATAHAALAELPVRAETRAELSALTNFLLERQF